MVYVRWLERREATDSGVRSPRPLERGRTVVLLAAFFFAMRVRIARLDPGRMLNRGAKFDQSWAQRSSRAVAPTATRGGYTQNVSSSLCSSRSSAGGFMGTPTELPRRASRVSSHRIWLSKTTPKLREME